MPWFFQWQLDVQCLAAKMAVWGRCLPKGRRPKSRGCQCVSASGCSHRGYVPAVRFGQRGCAGCISSETSATPCPAFFPNLDSASSWPRVFTISRISRRQSDYGFVWRPAGSKPGFPRSLGVGSLVSVLFFNRAHLSEQRSYVCDVFVFCLHGVFVASMPSVFCGMLGHSRHCVPETYTRSKSQPGKPIFLSPVFYMGEPV